MQKKRFLPAWRVFVLSSPTGMGGVGMPAGGVLFVVEQKEPKSQFKRNCVSLKDLFLSLFVCVPNARNLPAAARICAILRSVFWVCGLEICFSKHVGQKDAERHDVKRDHG